MSILGYTVLGFGGASYGVMANTVAEITGRSAKK